MMRAPGGDVTHIRRLSRKRGLMNCKRCGSEMKPSNVYHYVNPIMAIHPGYECFTCGMLLVGDEWIDGRADPDQQAGPDEEVEIPSDLHGGHVGFWLGVGEGEEPIHVLGDPDMSDETAKALAELAKAARRAVERGDFDNDETAAT